MALVVQNDTGTLDANGYISVAYFKTYHDNRVNDYTTFNGITTTDPMIAGAIVRATDYLDTRFDFIGVPLLNGVKATGVLTATANFTNGETVLINGVTYTFLTTLSAGFGHVQLAGSLATSLSNLAHAINTDGTAGTHYAAETTVNDDVSATSNSTTLTLTALVGGTAANAITTTETAANASWGDVTLTGGALQTTQWPRQAGSEMLNPWFDINFLTPLSDVTLVTNTFVAIVGPTGDEIIGVPVATKRACAEYAFRALGAGLFTDAPAPSAGPMPGRLIEEYSVKVDVISETTRYAPAQSGSFVMPAYPAADLLLVRAGLILGGRQLVR